MLDQARPPLELATHSMVQSCSIISIKAAKPVSCLTSNNVLMKWAPLLKTSHLAIGVGQSDFELRSLGRDVSIYGNLLQDL